MQKNRAEKRKQMQAKPASTTASTTAKKKAGTSDFGKAFAKARKDFINKKIDPKTGKPAKATFMFQGKRFNVQTADDRKKTIGLEKAREEGLTGGRPFETMGLKEARKAGLVGDQGRTRTGRGGKVTGRKKIQRKVKGRTNVFKNLKDLFKGDPSKKVDEDLKKVVAVRGGGMMKKMRGGGMIEKKMGGGMMGATKKVGMKKGGQVKTTKKVAMKKSSIDGIARKGKTRGRMV